MIDSDLIRKVKMKIRISHNVLDEDVEDTIAACLKDLQIGRIQVPTPDDPQAIDPLILNAIKLYCRAEFTEDTGKAADYMARYDALKSNLQMAEGYGEATGDE